MLLHRHLTHHMWIFVDVQRPFPPLQDLGVVPDPLQPAPSGVQLHLGKPKRSGGGALLAVSRHAKFAYDITANLSSDHGVVWEAALTAARPAWASATWAGDAAPAAPAATVAPASPLHVEDVRAGSEAGGSDPEEEARNMEDV